MKLVRYGPAGKEKPGLIDADGRLRDLSRKVKDIDGVSLAPASLKALAKLDTSKLPLVKGKPRLGPCVAMPSADSCSPFYKITIEHLSKFSVTRTYRIPTKPRVAYGL